ncbi:MAG: hypothetical protein AB1Z98_07355 [Nannocystaceae bacterium]
MRSPSRAGAVLVFTLGCGGRETGPQPSPAQPSTRQAAEVADGLDTDLPPERPSPLEIDLRERTDDGDDVVLKLTEAGARYGVARGKTRVALRYVVTDAALDDVYGQLRRNRFDRIETKSEGTGPTSGSSMRLKAGPALVSASAMGRTTPTPEWTEAYARSAAAVEALLPRAKTDVVVNVRWDASMEGRSAAIDFDLGEDFRGVHRGPGPMPNVELHLQRPRPLQVTVRHGSPPTSTSLNIEAGRDAGVEVAYDETTSAVVLRPIAAAPG